MPTKPLETILWREFSVAEAKTTIDIVSPLLQELVNFGTNVLARCSTSKYLSGQPDEDIASLALYRQIIELTDGLEVLISSCSTLAAIPVLRNLFEAYLSLDYILENEVVYKNRSLAWVVGHIHNRLDFYERLDPATIKGQDAKKLFDNDQINLNYSSLSSITIIDIQKAQQRLRNVLIKPHIQPIEAEYQTFKRPPRWYRLFKGPNDLRSLADRMKHGGQYELLYRKWSATSHAENMLHFLDRTESGDQAVRRMRDPQNIREIAYYSASFSLSATRLILSKLHPGEDISSWYKRDIRPRLIKIYDFPIDKTGDKNNV
jgi:hypothetical protein